MVKLFKRPKTKRRLTQVFRNKTQGGLFITLELATSRYRLEPGEELLLHYQDTDDIQVEFVDEDGRVALYVYTNESELFHTDGRAAVQNFEIAP